MDRPDPGALPARLRELIGAAHVLTGERATRRYRKGYRFGDGPVLDQPSYLNSYGFTRP